MTEICTHISHEHPALLIPCPQCGEDWKYVQIDERLLSRMTTENKILKEAVADAIKMAQEHHLTEAIIYFQDICTSIAGNQNG